MKDYFQVKQKVEDLKEFSHEKVQNPGYLRLKNIEGNVVNAKSKVLAHNLHYWKGKRGLFKGNEMEQWLNALKTKVGGVAHLH